MPSFPETAVCLHCGYSLRGLPENVCPECGRGFDPGEARSYWCSDWPRIARNWRTWADASPAWHPLLLFIGWMGALDSFYRPWLAQGGLRIEFIISTAILVALALSFFLRRTARTLCLKRGWVSSLSFGPPWRRRLVRVCAVVFSGIAVLISVLGPPRLLLSLPFMEHKARQVNRDCQTDDREQMVGLLKVKRVRWYGSEGGGQVEFEMPYGSGVLYYPTGATLPSDNRLLLTRWDWSTW